MKKIILILLIFIILAISNSCGQIDEDNSALSEKDKDYLLNLARQTVCWYLKSKTIPKPDQNDLSDNVLKKLGCFVTLDHKVKKLRGCIGIFERSEPLYKNVISRSIAALHDSRFVNDPVTYNELKDIRIEISVLTEPKDLKFNSPKDLLNKLKPGKDGVIIQTKYGGSTYLPQVWEHFSNDKEAFLSQLCRKHGAPMDTWKNDYKNVRIQIYHAIVFHESVYGRKVIGSKGAIVGKNGAFILGSVKPLGDNLLYGGGSVKQGTKLAPGAIVTSDSDIIEQ